jgi:hypothetical protein
MLDYDVLSRGQSGVVFPDYICPISLVDGEPKM